MHALATCCAKWQGLLFRVCPQHASKARGGGRRTALTERIFATAHAHANRALRQGAFPADDMPFYGVIGEGGEAKEVT